jgi:hypothetical protein
MSRKKKTNSEYRSLLYSTASLVLPSVVLRADDDATPGEMVDTAVTIAQDLLAVLDFTREGSDAT